MSSAVLLVGVSVPVRAEEDVAVDTTTTTVPTDTSETSPVESTEPPAEVETTQVPEAVETTAPSSTTPVTQAASESTVDVIVTYKRGVDVEQELEELAPVDVEHVYDKVLNGAAITVTQSDLAEMKSDPAVARVDLDTPVRAVTSSWGLDRIDQTLLPLSGTYGPRPTGSGVRVYVVDSGVSPHTEFGARLVAGFSVFVDGTGDCEGHGTHVAGTIAGTTVGVAPGATVVPVRVLGCRGSGYTSDTIDGVEWAVTNLQSFPGTRGVINMSIGGGLNLSLNEAVNNAVAAGVTVVVAAGNGNANACGTSPASAAAAITVGATSADDVRAPFSNYGSCVDIYAPGVGIYSASNSGGYETMSGTSMATPHVAGAVAVLAGLQSSATPTSLTNQILASATPGIVKGFVAGDTSPNRLLCVAPNETMSVTSTSLPVTEVGSLLATQLTASGGSGPYVWRVSSGALPNGYTLSSGGFLSGSSGIAVDAAFTVEASNNSCQRASQSLNLKVVVPPSTLPPVPTLAPRPTLPPLPGYFVPTLSPVTGTTLPPSPGYTPSYGLPPVPTLAPRPTLPSFWGFAPSLPSPVTGTTLPPFPGYSPSYGLPPVPTLAPRPTLPPFPASASSTNRLTGLKFSFNFRYW